MNELINESVAHKRKMNGFVHVSKSTSLIFIITPSV